MGKYFKSEEDKKKRRKTLARHQRTIAPELHKQWALMERKNDSTILAELLGVSKPTIDKALIYGCVHQQNLIDGITEYFSARLVKEQVEAGKLKQLNEQS